jgi:phosphopantothenoylcysteine decarboxylase/phosphopantothenate--cysteine ligase
MRKMPEVKNRKIILGISAGIAAYKTPDLIRHLVKFGAQVQVVMTNNAHHFVSAEALQAVSGRKVRDSLWDTDAENAMGHIELSRWADQILIAPATANCIGGLAAGMANDLLSTLCIATKSPIFVCPAMNHVMLSHPATQRNLKALSAMGYQIIPPSSGEQACGEYGPGRLPDPQQIIADIFSKESAKLNNFNVTVTAGPTREALDPVRYISNNSSGKQGMAIAKASLELGANVTLIAGPGVAPSREAIKRIDVCSAEEMLAHVLEEMPKTDLFISVAAVADYKAKTISASKIKKRDLAKSSPRIELEETPDIIRRVASMKERPLVIGFAAETNNAVQNAKIKLEDKNLDAIIVNDVSRSDIGFESTENEVTFVSKSQEIAIAKTDKDSLSREVIDIIYAEFKSHLEKRHSARLG